MWVFEQCKMICYFCYVARYKERNSCHVIQIICLAKSGSLNNHRIHSTAAENLLDVLWSCRSVVSVSGLRFGQYLLDRSAFLLLPKFFGFSYRALKILFVASSLVGLSCGSFAKRSFLNIVCINLARRSAIHTSSTIRAKLLTFSLHMLLLFLFRDVLIAQPKGKGDSLIGCILHFKNIQGNLQKHLRI